MSQLRRGMQLGEDLSWWAMSELAAHLSAMVCAGQGHVAGSEPHEKPMVVGRWHCLPCSFMPSKKGEFVA